MPVLIDGEVLVWESLAILEYLADKFPVAGLWPAEAGARGHLRARFLPRCMPASYRCGVICRMNMWRPVKPRLLDDAVKTDVARIDAIWNACRADFGGGGGAFLFGRFGAADAMYAPVVSRFHTYAVEVSDTARAPICARVMALPGLYRMAGCRTARNVGAAARRSRLAGGAEGSSQDCAPLHRGPALQKFFEFFQQTAADRR